MLTFAIRRIVACVLMLAGTSLVVFVMASEAADPLAPLREQTGVSAEVIEARRVELHLDEPVLARYVRWLKAAAQGDLGTSLEGRDVNSLLWTRMQVTLRMVSLATLLALVAGLTVGVASAVRQYSLLDHLGTVVSYLVLSLPVFWLAGLLKDLAIRLNRAVGVRLLFTVGEADPNLSGGLGHRLANHLGHLILPTLALMLGPAAVWSRYVRGWMLEVLSADYVRTARAKGLSPFHVVAGHALPNALGPFTTLAALHFGHLLAGAIVIERVFAWQGMGQMLLDGVRAADANVVTAWLLVTASMVFAFNLLADLASAWLDPRVRVS